MSKPGKESECIAIAEDVLAMLASKQVEPYHGGYLRRSNGFTGSNTIGNIRERGICNTTGIQNTMKRKYKPALLAVLCIAWICLTGCDSNKERREKWGEKPRVLKDKQGVEWVVTHHIGDNYTVVRKEEEM